MTDRSRRKFLIRSCQAAGALLIPPNLSSLAFDQAPNHQRSEFHLTPHYRQGTSIDRMLLKVKAGSDQFITEKYAAEIEPVLRSWSAELRHSPAKTEAIQQALASDFSGGSLNPVESKPVRSGVIDAGTRRFAAERRLTREGFVKALKTSLAGFSQLFTADFQITRVDGSAGDTIQTTILYELVGTGPGFHREQRLGKWAVEWRLTGNVSIVNWSALGENWSRAASPVFADISSITLGQNASYHAQLAHGSDYWRTVLDGASGIDIYGHNGVAVGDIDNDGYDDLYVCQAAGLPNRLYRNKRDGTFEDVTESSGLGILDNTACALFADFNNDGYQDLVAVRTSGPVLFLNQGDGKFREQPDAFQFATPPQGTFTGAAIADYDRDGWLDIYFCLYAYYQGTDQYRYPSPYYDAQNGPPNFMMRNNRDGTFRDVSAETGLSQNNNRYSFCCGWADYNNDGWPDLYVVNDFGRKNLYRNNGNGTFTDVADLVGAADVGAGMSVAWQDFNNDGAADLYVANMWTAPGERVSTQSIFQKDVAQRAREMYQKHAMGNTLLLNEGGVFRDRTSSAGCGNGRWSWSSDAWDFDHDGYQDLYVVNGMITGSSRDDLNSFFWRQVVANSPDEAKLSRDYEQGWTAINELIRSDGNWSGYERNVLFASNRDGTFSDVSGASGLDFIEDGRSFALTDFDHDGRLEVFLKNRNGPQLRVLKNVVSELPASIVFRLEGTKSNRDGIGALITISTNAGHQTRSVQAGSGFLSQHSKELHFGLGDTKNTVHATIQWPSGLVQRLRDLPLNHRIWVKEGVEPTRAEAFTPDARKYPSDDKVTSEAIPTNVSTWLLVPVLAPDFELPDLYGKKSKLSDLAGKPVLLTFWITESEDCRQQLLALQRLHDELQIVSVNCDRSDAKALGSFAQKNQLASRILVGSDDVSGSYNLVYRYLFDRHRDLPFPTSFLLNDKREIVKVYQGLADLHEQDWKQIPTSADARIRKALPFAGTRSFSFSRNYLSFGSAFFQRGYFDQAAESFQAALRDDPMSAEAVYGIGSVYLEQNKNEQAEDAFQRVLKMKAGYPVTVPNTWNNLGILATRDGRMGEAVSCFQRALTLNPDHLIALDNLGNAYRELKEWDKAQAILERAVAVGPDDAEAHYNLGMVHAQTDDTRRAEELLKEALRLRPEYPEALNNLGILYVRTQRVDEAVALFRQSIQVAPAFDKSYLSLARVYAIEGKPEEARAVLGKLLAQQPGHPQATQMLDQLK